MEADMSVYSLITRASILVQIVMLMLVSASVLSWVIIVVKYRILKFAKEEAERFEDQFWSGINLADLYSGREKYGAARTLLERALIIRERAWGAQHPETVTCLRSVLMKPEQEDWIDRIVSEGWVDTFRHFHPDTVRYSWWSYRFNARARDAGWRIDYFFASEDMIRKGWVKDAFIDNDIFGSDHCPVGLILEI